MSTFASFIRSWYAKTALSILASALLLIVSLPYAISYGVRDWLNQHGADDTQVDNVNFNLFSGRLEFINLRVAVGDDYTLVLKNAQLNTDWLPLFHKTVYISEFIIEDTNIAIEQKTDGKLIIGGISMFKKQALETAVEETSDTLRPWGVSIEKLSVRNSRFHFTRPDLNLRFEVDSATLTDLHSSGTEAAHLSLDGRLNDAPVSIDTLIQAFAETPSVDGTISLQNMPITVFKQLLARHVGIDAGRMAGEFKLTGFYDAATGFRLHNTGQISLSDVDINKADSQAKADQLKWNGLFETTIKPNGETPDVLIDGALEVANLALINRQDSAALLKLRSMKTDNIKASLTEASLGEISISTLTANIQRDERGAIILPAMGTAERAEPESGGRTPSGGDKPIKPNDTQASEPQQPTFALRIERVLVGDESAIRFTDKSTTPTFQSDVILDRVVIESLDTNKAQQATRFNAAGRIGKFSTFDAEGSAFPFAKKLNLDMKAKLTAVEMPPLSSYTATSLGHHLLSGQMDADIEVAIEDDIVDANSKLLIGNLQVKELTQAEKKKIRSTASAPLRLGINMLQDRDQHIRLELPLKGNIHAPEFDISDAINQVVVKAVSTAALTYLKLSLQPFGGLLVLADVAGDISKGVKLQPVSFKPGVTRLDEHAAEYKNKIAGILTERPGLKLKVCGVATPRDREALAAKEREVLKAKQAVDETKPDRSAISPSLIADEKLLEIARQRADALKGALIDEHRIEAGRLLACLARIDARPDAEPRVELGI